MKSAPFGFTTSTIFLNFVDGCSKSFAESIAFSSCFGSCQYFPPPQLLTAVLKALYLCLWIIIALWFLFKRLYLQILNLDHLWMLIREFFLTILLLTDCNNYRLTRLDKSPNHSSSIAALLSKSPRICSKISFFKEHNQRLFVTQ